MSDLRKLIIGGMGILTSLVLAVPGLASDGWERNSLYNSQFAARHMVHERGTVVKVDRDFVPMPGMSPGLEVDLKTGQGQVVTVEIGPRWFTNHYHDSWNLQAGDQLEVTGSQVIIAGKPVLMVSQGRKGQLQLTIRNSRGIPMWDPALAGF